MRIFALSDIHIDYDKNAQWVDGVSRNDYLDDVLILAGDISDRLDRLRWCIESFARRFRAVVFVPGNHDLWVVRDEQPKDSLQKLDEVRQAALDSGATVSPLHKRGVTIIPLLSWYDFSFGEPGPKLLERWADFKACRWPAGWTAREVAAHMGSLNDHAIESTGSTVITVSHFLPRIDVMPRMIPPGMRFIYPVLGTATLDSQLRRYEPSIHVYGHSHVNRQIELDGVTYINNAFGYPHERLIAAKRLQCITEA